jgi:methylthioribose-1-phosphate isomerase
MKTNQIPEIQDLAERHAQRHAEQRAAEQDPISSHRAKLINDEPEILTRLLERAQRAEAQRDQLLTACKAALAAEYGAPWEDALADIRAALAKAEKGNQ